MGLLNFLKENALSSEDRVDVPDHVSATETAEIVKGLQSMYPSRLTDSLAQANVALTLGGVRGQTEYYLHDFTPDDVSILPEVAQILGILNVHVSSHEHPIEDGSVMEINVVSETGMSRSTAMSNIPGIPRYDASSGKEEIDWAIEAFTGLQNTGLPIEPSALIHVLTGVMKGYPDVAVAGMADILGGNRIDDMDVSSQVAIPHAETLGGALPNFYCPPEEMGSLEVEKLVEEWGGFLGEFYKALGIE